MDRIALLIERMNYYRLLGPIVDRALQDGWEVECWHDYGHPQEGAKGSEFPDIKAAPSFMHGQPEYVAYKGVQELSRLVEVRSPGVVVALRSPLMTLGAPLSDASVRWVTVMHTWDFFMTNGPEGILCSDVSAICSDYWRSQGLTYFRRKGPLDLIDEERLRAKMVAVGFPEMDQIRLINREEVRARWNIPKGRPIVVLLPYPVASNPNSFWSRRVYSEPSKLKQALSVLVRRRFEYWRHVREGWNDVNLIRALRQFCDRNGAFLVAKSRLKDPIPAHTRRLSDLCLYDESCYPATILQTLSIADLCVNFYSTAVTEAAYLGVPNLCVTFSPEDVLESGELDSALFDLFTNPNEGGVFQFQGVSRTMTIPEVIKNLPQMSLDEFRIDPLARSKYVHKFLGYDDGESSRRVLDAARRLLTEGRAR